jgi:hypothetical protein
VPAANPHPGRNPPHDAILDIGDAGDAAPRRPGGLARSDDRFDGGHGGVGAAFGRLRKIIVMRFSR